MAHRKRSMFFALALALAPATPAFSAQAPACPDDFSASNIGIGKTWTFLDKDAVDGGAAQVTGGRLEISGKGADIYNEKNFFVGVSRSDIKGDFDVSVKIISQTNTHVWAQAGILIANNADSLKQGGYFLLDVSPGNGFTAFHDARDTVGWLETNKGAGTTAYPAWLRVKKAARRFSAWYKTSETGAWNVVVENIAPQLTAQDSHIALISLSHDNTKVATTVFDDFACLHAPSTAIPAKAPKAAGSSIPAGPPVDIAGRARRDVPAILWRVGPSRP